MAERARLSPSKPFVPDASRWTRHREERSDAAIQSSRSEPSSLDRFACARDDDGWSEIHATLSYLRTIRHSRTLVRMDFPWRGREKCGAAKQENGNRKPRREKRNDAPHLAPRVPRARYGRGASRAARPG